MANLDYGVLRDYLKKNKFVLRGKINFPEPKRIPEDIGRSRVEKIMESVKQKQIPPDLRG